MGSKLTTRGAMTRAKILAAAGRVIDAGGVAGLTIDRVCAEAEVSKSQFYHFFSSREILLQDIATTTVADVLDLQQPLFAELNSLAGFERWVDELVQLQVARGGQGGCPIGSLHSQLDEHHTVAHLILRDGYDHWEAAIRRGLAEMHDQGVLAADCDVSEQARLFLIAIQGGLILTDAYRDPTWLAHALAERLRVLRELTAVTKSPVETP